MTFGNCLYFTYEAGYTHSSLWARYVVRNLIGVESPQIPFKHIVKSALSSPSHIFAWSSKTGWTNIHRCSILNNFPVFARVRFTTNNVVVCSVPSHPITILHERQFFIFNSFKWVYKIIRRTDPHKFFGLDNTGRYRDQVEPAPSSNILVDHRIERGNGLPPMGPSIPQ